MARRGTMFHVEHPSPNDGNHTVGAGKGCDPTGGHGFLKCSTWNICATRGYNAATLGLALAC